MTPQGIKIPICFDTDREAVAHALDTLALPDVAQAKILRIADTLSLEILEASESYAEEIRARTDLTVIGEPHEMLFDQAGNLTPLPGPS